jgi:hypothetical protein
MYSWKIWWKFHHIQDNCNCTSRTNTICLIWSHLTWQSVFVHRFQVPGTHAFILPIIPTDSVESEQRTGELHRVQGALRLYPTCPPAVINHAAEAITWQHKREKTFVCFFAYLLLGYIVLLYQLHVLCGTEYDMMIMNGELIMAYLKGFIKGRLYLSWVTFSFSKRALLQGLGWSQNTCSVFH